MYREILRKGIKQEARVLSVFYLAAFIFSLVVDPFLVWLWLVPLALGFPFLKLYHLAEHGLCPFMDDKYLNTRTVASNSFVRFVTWNMPYHAEHHLLPSVPFHRLPDLHAQLNGYLGTKSTSYRGFVQGYLRFVSANKIHTVHESDRVDY